MTRAVICVAAAMLATVFVGTLFFSPVSDSNVAFADVRKEIERQVEGAKTITWKTVYYTRLSNKDGTRTWIGTQTNLEAYKAPGMYRDVRPGTFGIAEITIVDQVHGKKIRLFPEKKRAVLFVMGEPTKGAIQAARRDRFTQVRSNIPPQAARLGKMEIDGREAKGFRVLKWGGTSESRDYWVDSKTTRLLMIREPGLDLYDPEKDPTRYNPPEFAHYSQTILGCVTRDFAYDLKLDDALFSLDPPEGYTLKTYHRAEITENDAIQWLGVLAEYYGQRFPDDPLQYLPSAEDMNRIWPKPERARTPAERKIVARMKSNPDLVYHYPLHRFVEHTARNTWHYVGKGVKLGDKDRIICWYKLKDAENAKTYRAVYGDLSIKNVAPEALPLPVQP